MGFFSSATAPTATPATGGGFFATAQAPTPQRQVRAATEDQNEQQNQVLQATAHYANSPLGEAANFGGALIAPIAPAFHSGVQEAEEGASDAARATNPLQETEAGLKELSGTASAVTSPLAAVFDPINKGVNTAGEKLSDIPAVQRFSKSPGGKVTARAAQDVGDVANITGTVLGGLEGGAKVGESVPKEGFFATAKAPGPEAPSAEPAPSKTLAQMHEEYTKPQTAKDYVAQQNKTTSERVTEETRQNALSGKMESGRLPVGNDTTVYRAGDGSAKPGDFVTTSEARAKAYSGLRNDAPVTSTTVPSESLIKGARGEEYIYAPKSEGVSTIKPVESTGEARTPTLSTKVDANAVANKLSEGAEGLPEYNKVNWEEQGKFAADIVDADPVKAEAMLNGTEPHPPHVLATAIYKALEDYATKSGDTELIQRLANSPVTSAATRMGQEIGYLSQRDDLSPVKHIQDVQKARSSKGTPGKIKAEVDSIKSSMKATRSPKETWSSFADSISCR